jgi:hypothetical protein
VRVGIQYLSIIVLASAGFASIATRAIAQTEATSAPSPGPTSSPYVSAKDPCGDSNLLATTDRPTFGTNPCVVKNQEAILEFGYRNTTTSGQNGSVSVSYPSNRTRIGILTNLELVLDTPTLLRTTSNGTTLTTQSNLGTGLKYEIGYFGSFVHGFAAEAILPTASTGLAAHTSYNGSYQIGGGIFKNVGFNLTLGATTGTVTRPSGVDAAVTSFQPTLIVGGLIAAATKLNVEVAGSSANGPGTSGQYFGNVFLQHQLSKSLLVDVEASQRFTVVSHQHLHYFGAGGSVRI